MLYYIISYYIKLSYIILYYILLYYIISYQCTHPCQEGETMSDYHLFLMILESETIIFHGVVSLFLLGFSWSSIVCLCSFTYFKMILNDFKPSFPVIFDDLNLVFLWFSMIFGWWFHGFSTGSWCPLAATAPAAAGWSPILGGQLGAPLRSLPRREDGKTRSEDPMEKWRFFTGNI